MAGGFKKLRPDLPYPGVEDEAEVYKRRYPKTKKRGMLSGLFERIRGVTEGARPMPKWRLPKEHEQEDM
jgi:hypothetical protein